jgi:hypothetical protein
MDLRVLVQERLRKFVESAACVFICLGAGKDLTYAIDREKFSS